MESWRAHAPLRESWALSEVVVTDLNGDGVTEVAAISEVMGLIHVLSGEYSTSTWEPDPDWEAETSVFSEYYRFAFPGPPAALIAADPDLDGNRELFVPVPDDEHGATELFRFSLSSATPLDFEVESSVLPAPIRDLTETISVGFGAGLAGTATDRTVALDGEKKWTHTRGGTTLLFGLEGAEPTTVLRKPPSGQRILGGRFTSRGTEGQLALLPVGGDFLTLFPQAPVLRESETYSVGIPTVTDAAVGDLNLDGLDDIVLVGRGRTSLDEAKPAVFLSDDSLP